MPPAVSTSFMIVPPCTFPAGLASVSSMSCARVVSLSLTGRGDRFGWSGRCSVVVIAPQPSLTMPHGARVKREERHALSLGTPGLFTWLVDGREPWTNRRFQRLSICDSTNSKTVWHRKEVGVFAGYAEDDPITPLPWRPTPRPPA